VGEWIIPLLSLTGVLITAIFAFVTGRASGAAVKDIAAAASTLIEPLEKRIAAMETALIDRDNRLALLRAELEDERRKRRELSILVESLEERITGLSSENGHLRLENSHLEKQLKKLGGAKDTL